MEAVVNSALASTQDTYMTGGDADTTSLNELSFDDLNSNEVSGDFNSLVSSFMNGIDKNAQSVLASAKGTLSPKSMLDVQRNMISYSVSIQATSKIAGELSKGFNQLTSIQ